MYPKLELFLVVHTHLCSFISERCDHVLSANVVIRTSLLLSLKLIIELHPNVNVVITDLQFFLSLQKK